MTSRFWTLTDSFFAGYLGSYPVCRPGRVTGHRSSRRRSEHKKVSGLTEEYQRDPGTPILVLSHCKSFRRTHMVKSNNFINL